MQGVRARLPKGPERALSGGSAVPGQALARDSSWVDRALRLLVLYAANLG